MPGGRRARARPPTATTRVQLAFEEVPAKRLNKPETGPPGEGRASAPHRHLREFRGTTELTVGETVTVEVFGPGDHIKVTGTSIGKGFAGTIKRHNFGRGPESHGSHNVRKPGSIGQSAQPSRVFKGVRMSRPHGRRARHPARPRGRSTATPTRNVILVSGSVPGSKGGLVEIREDATDGRSRPPSSAARRPPSCDESVFGLEVERAAAARGREGRGGGEAPGHARHEDPRPGGRRSRQAVAPEGHRPRPPGHDPRRALARRRRRLRAAARARTT